MLRPATPATLRAGGARSIDIVGMIGGNVGSAVSVEGQYGYVAVGRRLIVLDLASPQHPEVVGQSDILPEPIQSLTVANGNAYIADGSAGVFVVDIANPRQPALVGSPIGLEARHVVISGSYAYMAGADGLRVFRLTPAARPTPLAQLPSGSGYTHLAAVDHYLYAGGSNGVHIFDIADPSRPVEIAIYSDVDSVSDISIADHYAWIGTAELSRSHAPRGRVHVVDIANPAKPSRVSELPMNGPVSAVLVQDGLAHVAAVAELQILDATNPSHARPVSIYRSPAEITDLAVAGEYLYLTSSNGDSLRVLNIAHPEQPTEAGSFGTPKSAYTTAVRGHLAYVADAGRGLLVLDISDPHAPVPVGSSTPFYAWDLVLQGDYAYVASSQAMRILSLADPIHPMEVGAAALGDMGMRLAVAGNRAYVAAGKEFDIIDVSQPSVPAVLSSTVQPDLFALDVAIAGHYALVASGSGLRVVDVSDSAHPQQVGFLRTPGWAFGVAAEGNYAYVAASGAGLRVVDVTDPANPVEIAWCKTSNALAVTVDNKLAYVADGFGGLRVISIADPRAPVEVDSLIKPLTVGRVTVDGDRILVTGAQGAVVILVRTTR